MGFFSGIGAINKINTLLRTIEPKVTAIENECRTLHPSVSKIKKDAHTVCVLMNEIIEIADSAGESVRTATFFFFNEKTNLINISRVLADMISMCNQMDENTFR